MDITESDSNHVAYPSPPKLKLWEGNPGDLVEDGAKVIETEHPNPEKYPNQKILIVDVDGYAYLVPFVADENSFFLKTIIPGRKATRQYFGGKHGK